MGIMRHDLTSRNSAQARTQAMDVHAAAQIFNILLAIGGLIVLWTALVTL
jgi:hypothetical protein